MWELQSQVGTQLQGDRGRPMSMPMPLAWETLRIPKHRVTVCRGVMGWDTGDHTQMSLSPLPVDDEWML